MSFARAAKTFAVASLFVLGTSALSQQPSAVFQGTVVESGTDVPIAKATVELRTTSGEPSVAASTITDSAGKFYLPAMASGSFRIVASHPGHVLAEFGERPPGGPGTPLTLNNPPANIRIAMTQ